MNTLLVSVFIRWYILAYKTYQPKPKRSTDLFVKVINSTGSKCLQELVFHKLDSFQASPDVKVKIIFKIRANSSISDYDWQQPPASDGQTVLKEVIGTICLLWWPTTLSYWSPTTGAPLAPGKGAMTCDDCQSPKKGIWLPPDRSRLLSGSVT